MHGRAWTFSEEVIASIAYNSRSGINVVAFRTAHTKAVGFLVVFLSANQSLCILDMELLYYIKRKYISLSKHSTPHIIPYFETRQTPPPSHRGRPLPRAIHTSRRMFTAAWKQCYLHIISRERFDLESPNFTRTFIPVRSTSAPGMTSLSTSGWKLSAFEKRLKMTPLASSI